MIKDIKKKICFITGTRADYGIMKPVMEALAANENIELQIIATNMHLSEDYGTTVKEIEKDGFEVTVKLPSLEKGGNSRATVISMANEERGLADAFESLKPDLVVILGDRYEALAAASAAVVFNIPVAHLHGGEITEGAIDDKFRNAITQLSDLHFAATPQYAARIISMGKTIETVHHSGAPGAEMKEIAEDEDSALEFFDKTGLRPGEPFIILAFHPVTIAPDKGKSELEATLKALDTFIDQGYKVLVTLPNSDPGTGEITDLLKAWGESKGENVSMVTSLGSRMFHYALEHALAIVGNSSAALIEAPSHRLGSVNVGIRQKGRAHGPSVLDTPGEVGRIRMALEAVMSLEMKAVLLGVPVSTLNPYYKEDSAKFIAKEIENFVKS